MQRLHFEMEWFRKHRFALSILSTYTLVLGFGLRYHVMWLDEAQAWLIARDSHGIKPLLHALRYEGHPSLYYLILMPITRMTQNPVAMQWMNFFVMVGVVALILFRAPFTKMEKLLSPMGYCILYEYGFKSRSYSIGLLIVCIVCCLWEKRRERPVILSTLLAVLANIHLFYLFMSIGFVAAAVYDAWRLKSARLVLTFRRIAAIWLILGLGYVLAILTIRPIADSDIGGGWYWKIDAGRMLDVLDSFAGFFGASASTPLGAAALLCMSAAILRTRRCAPAVSVFFVVSAGMITAFIYLRYRGLIWHYSLFFVIFLAAAWLCRLETKIRNEGTRRDISCWPMKWLLPIVLIAQAAYGVATARLDLTYPLSCAKTVGLFLRQHGFDKETVGSYDDVSVIPIIAYAQLNAVYALRGARWESFIVWDRARNGAFYPDANMLQFASLSSRSTFISVEPLSVGQLEKAGLVQIARFSGARDPAENIYYVYRRDRDISSGKHQRGIHVIASGAAAGQCAVQ